MTIITNDSSYDMEQLTAIAVAGLKQEQQNKALIAEYRALAAAQGKVWSELTEEQITQMIIEHETAKATLLVAKEYKPKPTPKKRTHPCCQFSAGGCDCDCDSDIFVSEPAPLPPQWFDLLFGESKPVLDHICHLTQRFTVLDPDFAYWLIDRIGRRRFTTFGYLPAPPSVDIVKQVIGTDGYFFKLTTSNTGVDFIWHDRTKNNFLFWGEKPNVIQAMKIIRSRIVKLSS